MGIIAFIIIGLVAGLIARAILPGKQSMGLIATTILGMIGSLVGGLIGSAFTRGDQAGLSPAGLILSVVGAIAVLFIYSMVTGRRGGRRATV